MTRRRKVGGALLIAPVYMLFCIVLMSQTIGFGDAGSHPPAFVSFALGILMAPMFYVLSVPPFIYLTTIGIDGSLMFIAAGINGFLWGYAIMWLAERMSRSKKVVANEP